jgi:hypothetical protein
MNMPGFTAEASLKEVSNRYSAAVLVWQPSGASQAIHPAQNCVSDCFMARCGPRAMWCGPTQKADVFRYCYWKCFGEEF